MHRSLIIYRARKLVLCMLEVVFLQEVVEF